MKTIYRIIQTCTKYKHNLVYSDVQHNTYIDLGGFKSHKDALDFLKNKCKEFENKNNSIFYRDVKYTKLKQYTWKYQTIYDMYHSGDYSIYNFSIIKLYSD